MLRKKAAVPDLPKNPNPDTAKTAEKGADKTVPVRTILNRIICVLLIIVVVLMSVWGYIQHTQKNFVISFYHIVTSKVSEEFRIVFLADLHEREYGEDNCDLVDDVKELNPDIILCGGDMLNYGEANYEPMLTLYTQLSKISPTYAIMGNHEDALIFLDGRTEIPDLISETGVKVLRNQMEEISLGSSHLEIIGLSGGPEQYMMYGGDALMQQLPPETNKFRICMCHVPIVFPDCLSEYDFDLGLAGHNHGGIIKLPKLGPLYSCEDGFFPKYAYGMKDINGKPLIVSGGLGDSNHIPRINNMPEVVVVDVNCY